MVRGRCAWLSRVGAHRHGRISPSNGGDGIVPWRLMTLLRERAKRVNVLVPHHALQRRHTALPRFREGMRGSSCDGRINWQARRRSRRRA
jgi:hypothetical protein